MRNYITFLVLQYTHTFINIFPYGPKSVPSEQVSEQASSQPTIQSTKHPSFAYHIDRLYKEGLNISDPTILPCLDIHWFMVLRDTEIDVLLSLALEDARILPSTPLTIQKSFYSSVLNMLYIDTAMLIK